MEATQLAASDQQVVREKTAAGGGVGLRLGYRMGGGPLGKLQLLVKGCGTCVACMGAVSSCHAPGVSGIAFYDTGHEAWAL